MINDALKDFVCSALKHVRALTQPPLSRTACYFICQRPFFHLANALALSPCQIDFWKFPNAPEKSIDPPLSATRVAWLLMESRDSFKQHKKPFSPWFVIEMSSVAQFFIAISRFNDCTVSRAADGKRFPASMKLTLQLPPWVCTQDQKLQQDMCHIQKLLTQPIYVICILLLNQSAKWPISSGNEVKIAAPKMEVPISTPAPRFNELLAGVDFWRQLRMRS